MDSAMTFEEFEVQAKRLHSRYPLVYSRKNQVKLAFVVSGRSLEWFKFRVDYVIRSGEGPYDWGNASSVVWNEYQEFATRAGAAALGIDPHEYSEPLENILEKEGALSVTELIERRRNTGEKPL